MKQYLSSAANLNIPDYFLPMRFEFLDQYNIIKKGQQTTEKTEKNRTFFHLTAREV